jgi:hypothetical protein
MPREFREQRLTFWIGGSITHEHPNPPNLIGLLRTRRERPSSRRATDKCDEFASPHRPAPQTEGITLPCCGLHCASRQILAANVRFGSKADIAMPSRGVRFTPKSGHEGARSACKGALSVLL